MQPHEEFFLFLEEHPELHPITQSELYLSILEFIGKKASSMQDLKMKFSRLEEQDLALIVKSLIQVGLVKKVRVMDRELYYSEELAKELLEKYEKAKSQFSTFDE